MPRFVKHLPGDFLTRLYSRPEWLRAIYQLICDPAVSYKRVVFNAHIEFTPVIANMFKEDEIDLMQHTWDFLHEAYTVPTFKEEDFQSCDMVTLEIIRSVKSTHTTRWDYDCQILYNLP